MRHGGLVLGAVLVFGLAALAGADHAPPRVLASADAPPTASPHAPSTTRERSLLGYAYDRPAAWTYEPQVGDGYVIDVFVGDKIGGVRTVVVVNAYDDDF